MATIGGRAAPNDYTNGCGAFVNIVELFPV